MKKFFSLLCATLLVFSASAAPQAKKAEVVKKAPVAVEQMQKVQFEKAQIANFNQLSATPELKVINQEAKAKIGPKELAAQSRSVAPKKAPQDYTTTYNYKCGPTEVVVTDLSTPNYSQFKLAITQKAKNTSEYTKETLYDNTVELIINPDEHSIVGTFTTDDYSIDANTFLKSGSSTRYVSSWEPSTITIVSKGGNKYAITDGLLQVESSNGNYLYKYNYCYAAADLNNQDAEKTAFEFTFGEEPTPATWDTIGKSSVKDGVVAYLLGDTEDAAAYNVTTLQKGNSYKMVNLFGSANPAYNKIKDHASYKKAEIEIDATDANNVTIAKQKIGWTGALFSEVYEIEASNGKLANGVITFAAANIKFYEDGETPYAGYGDLVITLPKEEPKIDTIPVTVVKYQEKYYASSLDWQVIMQDAAGNGYSFDIFAPAEGLESGKTYTSDNGDFDLDYTFASIIVNMVNEAAVKASFTKTETEDALTVTAEMTTAANHVYQVTYNLDKTVEIVDANGIIIQPAKGTTKEYNRLATNTCFYYNSGTKLAYQSGTATLVECADGTVYWKDPVSKYAQGTWIKGKKEGSTITFATKQPVSYNSTYKVSTSVRWGNFDPETGFKVADDYADSFILDIKGDSLIMRGTQATFGDVATYFPGIFWDDDDSFNGYGDCGVNLYLPGWTPSTELITPPAGLVTAKMPFTGSGDAEDYADSVLVGWDKDTVYIQGLAVDFPTAWIKGVLKEGVVTFEKFQFVGKVSGTMPIWVLGTNAESELIDFTMTYDAQANLFKATNIFVVNASYEKIYYLDKVSKIVIGEVAQADWGEWEDFAPFGYNTGSWTFVAMATSPKTYSNYVALVRTDKNNADNKQIKITNWGEGWFGEGVELIINWNAKDNTCSIDKQYTGYTDTQYGKVSVSSVEDGTYNPETGTFSIHVDYTVSAGSFGNDVETYVMDAKQPGLMYDTDAPFDATFAYSDMSADLDEGVIGIYATNAEGYTIGLELYADPAATEIPAGVYTISATQEAGTALQSLGVAGGYLTECYAGTLAASGGISDWWFLVEGTITLEYDEYDKLKVVVNGTNSWGQPVTALVQYVKLEPKSTVDIVSTNLSYTDEWYAEYGIQEFVLTNDNYGVLLDIFADTLVGEFTEDDVDLADSYIVDFNTNAKIPVVNTGDIVVTLDGKNLTLTTTLIGADTIQYNISATGYLGYIQGDAVEGYVGEFAMENVTLLQATKSQVMINGFNEVGDTVAIVFDAKFSKTAGTIVEPQAGEYDVIMASTGFTAEYDVYPSFVGNNAGVWFIQSGKLIIAEDGSMAFLGVNSYDAPVAINFTVPVTGLRNAKANVKAAKQIKNGQIIIVRENKEYNILGAAL